jgi:hypothetical protein
VYWKEVHREAWRRTRQSGFLEWKRLSTAVVLPVMSGLIQWRAGVSVPINIIVNLGSGLFLYTVLIFIERYLHIRAVVVERDDYRAQAIADRDRRISELVAAGPAGLRALILEVRMDQSNYSEDSSMLAFTALAEFRNPNGPDTSIHGLRLWFLDNEEGQSHSAPIPIARTLANGQIWRERLTVTFHPIDKGTAQRALAVGSEWKLTFMDIHDKQYESEVFTKTD